MWEWPPKIVSVVEPSDEPVAEPFKWSLQLEMVSLIFLLNATWYIVNIIDLGWDSMRKKVKLLKVIMIVPQNSLSKCASTFPKVHFYVLPFSPEVHFLCVFGFSESSLLWAFDVSESSLPCADTMVIKQFKPLSKYLSPLFFRWRVVHFYLKLMWKF